MLFKSYSIVLIICVQVIYMSAAETVNLREKRTPQNDWWIDSLLSHKPDDITGNPLRWKTESRRTWNTSPPEKPLIRDFYHTIEHRQTNENNYAMETYNPTYNEIHQRSPHEWNPTPYSLYDRGPPPPPPDHMWNQSENSWRPPPPPHEERRSPQGPPFMRRGPGPPPRPGTNSFDNRGPPYGRGPPFEQQPPDHRGPPGEYQYWIPPGHRNRPNKGNRQDGYDFQEMYPHQEITTNVNRDKFQTTEKIKNDAHKIKKEEQSTKKTIITSTESNTDTNTAKGNVKITYDAGPAVALVNGNSKPGTKIVPVTLIFQAQPVTPAT